MKRTILILICLVVASPALAQEQYAKMNPAVLGVVAAVAGCTAFCASCTGTCVYCEDFEGTTDCDAGAGEQLFCRYGYTLDGADATFAFNNAQTTEQCSSCATRDLKFTRAGTDASVVYVFGDIDPAYISLFIKISSVAEDGSWVFEIMRWDLSTPLITLISYRPAATTNWRLSHNNKAGSTAYDLGPEIVADQWYHMEWYWLKNQDAGGLVWKVDGVGQTIADGTTKGSSMNAVKYRVRVDNVVVQYDNIRIQTDDYPTCD